MSDPVRFLTAFAHALATLSLYDDGHPARARAVDASFAQLERVGREDAQASFSFGADGVEYGARPIPALAGWEWARRLAEAGVPRLEIEEGISRERYGAYLDDVASRLAPFSGVAPSRAPRRTPLVADAIGARGATLAPDEPGHELRVDLAAEADAVRWMHDEVRERETVPMLEVEGVVRSLSLAMRAETGPVLPRLDPASPEAYTTTHAMNVAVLAMGLAESLGLSTSEVRAYGVAALLHDVGKVRVPAEILFKPGNLAPPEWEVMRRHPVEGARIILGSDARLDLAAVVAFEHHIMIDGGGYPSRHYRCDCHPGSSVVHVCDVYDALRTRRPYREGWDHDAALAYIERGIGSEFDADAGRAFLAMMRSRPTGRATAAPTGGVA